MYTLQGSFDIFAFERGSGKISSLCFLTSSFTPADPHDLLGRPLTRLQCPLSPAKLATVFYIFTVSA